MDKVKLPNKTQGFLVKLPKGYHKKLADIKNRSEKKVTINDLILEAVGKFIGGKKK